MRFTVKKHAGLLSDIENLNIESVNNTIRGLTQTDLTEEGFIGNLLGRFSTVIGSTNTLPSAIDVINTKALKAPVVRRILGSSHFITVGNLLYTVDNNYAGNRLHYVWGLRDLIPGLNQSLMVSDDITQLMEMTYAQKHLASPFDIDTSYLDKSIRDFDDFMSRFFSGDGDQISIAASFDNTDAINRYMNVTRTLKPSPDILVNVHKRSKRLAERLRLLKSEDGITAGKLELKELSKIILKLAKAQSAIGKVYYLTNNNVNVAKNILDVLENNTQ